MNLNYRHVERRGSIKVRPYVFGEDLVGPGISVSVADKQLETLVGGGIAEADNDPLDKWYINKEFLMKNYRMSFNDMFDFGWITKEQLAASLKSTYGQDPK